MKKMLIAAISAIAVIASVIGCQVYDSQDNSVLYSAMNAQKEGAISFQEYIAKFNEMCKDLSSDDTTDDSEAYNLIFDTFYGYDEFEAAATKLAANDPSFTGDATKSLYNVDDVKAYCKANCVSKTSARNAIVAGYADGKESADIVIFGSVGEFTISSMYEKQCQLKWDWNSKKGR